MCVFTRGGVPLFGVSIPSWTSTTERVELIFPFLFEKARILVAWTAIHLLSGEAGSIHFPAPPRHTKSSKQRPLWGILEPAGDAEENTEPRLNI